MTVYSKILLWSLYLTCLIAGIALKGIEPPFPRLGLWWPSTEEEALKQIARYDWVALFPYEVKEAVQIKKINPRIKLLTSTNACELSFDPDYYNGSDNELLRKIPAEWFLTQVGSVIRENIDEKTTIIPVEAVRLTFQDKEIELFTANEAVLIEGETMFVEFVEDDSRTLKVKRGFIRPASSHKKGTRIAAHISFWPNTWIMNLSHHSLKNNFLEESNVDSWAEYNAQLAIALLKEPVWDGILIDRSDANASWLIGNSTARSIDPDQSNRLLANYHEFDKTWNEGLTRYEQTIRKAIGRDKLIVVNWGMPNVHLLNGNTFEGFPRQDSSSYQTTWYQTVFGTVPFGSYMFWNQNALHPNLTLIQTYEDDSFPEPTFKGEYDNPCEKPNFEPNYQKMRFGLATALLGDGYFSYEMNTNGHASLCLMWFDEYDNNGEERGYLGMPIKKAERIIKTIDSPNLIPSGSFDNDEELSEWTAWAKDGAEIETVFDKSENSARTSALINLNNGSGIDWEASFSFEPIDIKKGNDYTLSFWAKADKERPITVWLQQNQEPWTVVIDFGRIFLNNQWQHFQLSLPATREQNSASLQFAVGEADGKVWLDDVRLQQGSMDVYWREFEHGIVLVNATSQKQEIELPKRYKKIKGDQVPSINDGSLVSKVNLSPRDGLILLNP